MTFNDIKERLTGISCPCFGISWSPTETDRTITRKMILLWNAKDDLTTIIPRIK